MNRVEDGSGWGGLMPDRDELANKPKPEHCQECTETRKDLNTVLAGLWSAVVFAIEWDQKRQGCFCPLCLSLDKSAESKSQMAHFDSCAIGRALKVQP